jgi:hypothetical protein
LFGGDRLQRSHKSIINFVVLLSLVIAAGWMVIRFIPLACIDGPESWTHQKVQSIAYAIVEYQRDFGRLPLSLDDLTTETASNRPWFFFLDDTSFPFTDNFGNHILFETGSNTFCIRSLGRDGRCETRDDIAITAERIEAREYFTIVDPHR